jgi:hypothetical protein
MSVETEALLRGIFHLGETGFTLTLTDSNGKEEDGIWIPNRVFTALKEAIRDSATSKCFLFAWNEFASTSENPTVQHNINSGPELIKRYNDSHKFILPAYEGMQLPIITSYISEMYKLFESQRDSLLQPVLFLKNLLQDIMKEGGNKILIAKLFSSIIILEDIKFRWIIPVFSAKHAVYAVIEKDPDNENYFIAICNGGVGNKCFCSGNVGSSDKLGHCIMYTKLKSTVEAFLSEIGDHWGYVKVSGTKGIFISLGEWIKAQISSGLLSQFSETELYNGTVSEFSTLSVSITRQERGNCAVHNLMESLIYCKRLYPVNGVPCENLSHLRLGLNRHFRDYLITTRKRIQCDYDHSTAVEAEICTGMGISTAKKGFPQTNHSFQPGVLNLDQEGLMNFLQHRGGYTKEQAETFHLSIKNSHQAMKNAVRASSAPSGSPRPASTS